MHSLLVLFAHNVEDVYGDAVEGICIDCGLHERQEGADNSGRNYQAAEVEPEGGTGWESVPEVPKDSARSPRAAKIDLTNQEPWRVRLGSEGASGLLGSAQEEQDLRETRCTRLGLKSLRWARKVKRGQGTREAW